MIAEFFMRTTGLSYLFAVTKQNFQTDCAFGTSVYHHHDLRRRLLGNFLPGVPHSRASGWPFGHDEDNVTQKPIVSECLTHQVPLLVVVLTGNFIVTDVRHGFLPGVKFAVPLAGIGMTIWHLIWIGFRTGYTTAVVVSCWSRNFRRSMGFTYTYL